MDYLIDWVSGYVFTLPFFVPLSIFVYFYYKRKEIAVPTGFVVAFQLLILYLVSVSSITGTGSVQDAVTNGGMLLRPDEINLIPFSDWSSYNVFGMLMNVLLFLPLGVALPLLWKQGTSLGKTVLYGFTLSALIEFSQLFNHRATDVNDLIMNTLGTLLGYGIYALALRRVTALQINNSQKHQQNHALYAILMIFAILFFVGKPFIRFVWWQIYLSS